MSQIAPFRALRPAPETAAEVAAVPYDVVSTEEARELVAGNPLSFLRVTRSEVDLPPGTPPYDSRVYAQASRNFEELKRAAPLTIELAPALYFYRVKTDWHEQIGLAGCFSLEEYSHGVIKKHERTRKDKEDDRTRHITELRAQTGIAFLTYRAIPAVNAVAQRVSPTPPLYDFVAPDGVTHTIWRVTGADVSTLVDAFRALPSLYIADGHHRVASAARAHDLITGAGTRRRTLESDFVAVAFPDTQVCILPYNRVAKDLGSETPESFLVALQSSGVAVRPGQSMPERRGDVSMYLAGEWYTLTLPPPDAGASRIQALDVDLLQRRVLEPLLKIGDVRTDKRIDFVGGIRGPVELERLVDEGAAAVAFSMYPVNINDLMAIADTGEVMPPKSTWFEPKLRDGLLVHLI
ncbi:MAG TPA: DUF1015 family protein [Vicinamibacterales bacterium]|nr:DUF1015 family protein [Vicinamibacterales bacterium]